MSVASPEPVTATRRRWRSRWTLLLAVIVVVVVASVVTALVLRSQQQLYIAAESGTVAVLDQRDRTVAVLGSGHLADGAHVVAVDPATHHSFYPIPHGSDGHPALLEQEPVP